MPAKQTTVPHLRRNGIGSAWGFRRGGKMDAEIRLTSVARTIAGTKDNFAAIASFLLLCVRTPYCSFA
jgi:hypothetical protein